MIKRTKSTAYHSQYWAHALTLRGSGGDIAALSRSIANARVDLNPHQIDAALFALRSPFTKGVILKAVATQFLAGVHSHCSASRHRRDPPLPMSSFCNAV